ncbi:hypothetical protein [Luethyella okanaganae]|uniref:Uncharacterized protein n=1 Tax=Luethyella okanaganae TaxID=69372 RepID=A0ABW1VHP7_9MICO
MTTVAVGAGWLLGNLLPVPIAIPVAIFGLLQWVTYPLIDAVNLSWRNIAGYAVFACCDLVNFEPDLRAVLAPLVIAAAIAILVILSIRRRLLYWAIPAVPLIALAVIAANAIVVGTGPTGGELRPAADLRCTQEQEPTVCLFPETIAAGGGPIIATLTDGYRSAQDHGVSLPERVSATSSEAVDSSATTVADFSVEMDRDQILSVYATAVFRTLTCRTPEVSSDAPPELVVSYALARVMGGDETGVLPSVSIGLGEEGSNSGETPLTADEVIDALNVRSMSDAEAVVTAWYEQQENC